MVGYAGRRRVTADGVLAPILPDRHAERKTGRPARLYQFAS